MYRDNSTPSVWMSKKMMATFGANDFETKAVQCSDKT